MLLKHFPDPDILLNKQRMKVSKIFSFTIQMCAGYYLFLQRLEESRAVGYHAQ